MKIVRVSNYEEMSKYVSDLIVNVLKDNKDACINFTTGATPYGTIKNLVYEINNGLDISSAKFLNLDEYVGDPHGEYAVCNYMYKNLYNLINKKPQVIDMFTANAKDTKKEISRYKKVLEDYPVDFQMLGLGTNAHIAANEPGTPFDSECFIADSFESTIQATKNLYNLSYDDTPKQMYTMGFTEIMKAKTVLLFASGKSKAEAVKSVVEGDISEDIPASILKRHNNFILVIDDEAASLLSRVE